MLRRIPFALPSTLVAAGVAFTQAGDKGPAGDDAGWALVSKSVELTIFNRDHGDSNIKEFKAVGVIGVPPATLKHVIDDAEEYPNFMPYVAESRVLSRGTNTLVGYQRLNVPLVSDRDCTIKVYCETFRRDDGRISYRNRWETANALGPPERPGVVRVTVNEGSWLLQPTDNGAKTLATYRIYTDSGGKLPAFVVNRANKTALPKLFAAIREQSQLAKYSRGTP